MKKTNRIRILIFCAALAAGVIGYGTFRYQMILNEREEEQLPLQANLPREEDTEADSVESAKITPPHQYVVVDEEGFLTVYLDDTETVYMYTGIASTSLPIEVQEEICTGKTFTNLEDLYRFLESYSS